MLKGLSKILYVKVLVSIVIARLKTTVYVEVSNAKGVLDIYEEVFETTSLSSEMQEYITSFTNETPFFHIAVLDNTPSQGVIPTCSKEKRSYFYDLSASEHKCFNEKDILHRQE